MTAPYQGALFPLAEPVIPYVVPDVDVERARRLAQHNRLKYNPDLLPAWLRLRINVAPGACWIWTGGLTDAGYGQVWEQRDGNPTFGSGSPVKRVHRLVFELLVRPLEPGEILDHLCLVRSCCNPADVEPVTTNENARRGSSSVVNGGTRAVKTHCLRGHLLPPPEERRGGCRQCTSEITYARAHGLPHPDTLR